MDVTESALLRPCFPGVKYLRIDGSVSRVERTAAVDRFSADPSVAILLLTTKVGHLGLNLSAASMVVFLEHDWNPQVDLQVRRAKLVLGHDYRVTGPYQVLSTALFSEAQAGRSSARTPHGLLYFHRRQELLVCFYGVCGT